MNLTTTLQRRITEIINTQFGVRIPSYELVINATPDDYEGDYTLVVFPLAKVLRKAPPQIAEEIGKSLLEKEEITTYNVVQGFLNLELKDEDWLDFSEFLSGQDNYGRGAPKNEKVLVEYSSPNTNKPLHLGHVRNIVLGWSVSQILKEVGYEVYRVQVINDRGIAICKSMLAWQKYGDNKTPEQLGVKGDKFVGDLYVRFDQEVNKEYISWQSSPEADALYEKNGKSDSRETFFKKYKNTYFNEFSHLGLEAKQMLQKWENDDPETMELWRMMNGWVYEGMNQTYDRLGVGFDKNYYESDTYLLGKEYVEAGLEKGVFYRQDDSSVWIDLSDVGMDQKIVLRSDGTSVYMTQDLGTAEMRYQDFGTKSMIYVVANEQDYHFQVLFEICKRLVRPYADGLHHLSYNLVELPEGRMKTREGTVVDADDLMDEVIAEARQTAVTKGEVSHMTGEEIDEISSIIGIGSIKYFIIRVSPTKRVVFNPEESLDMHGQTAPYIQNAYVRTQSILAKAGSDSLTYESSEIKLEKLEKHLLRMLDEYPAMLKEAAVKYDPSDLANYAYKLAKLYHRYYSEVPVLTSDSNNKNFRLTLNQHVAKVLKRVFYLIGIDMPTKM